MEGDHSCNLLDFKPWWYHLFITCFSFICSKQTWSQWATISVTLSLWLSLHPRLDWKGKATYTWWFTELPCKWRSFLLVWFKSQSVRLFASQGQGCSQHLWIFNGAYSSAAEQSHYSDQLLDEPGLVPPFPRLPTHWSQLAWLLCFLNVLASPSLSMLRML